MPAAVRPSAVAGSDPVHAVLAKLRSQAAQGLLVIVSGAGVAAAASILIAKLLSATEFGVFIFSITLMNYAVTVARGGMDSSSVRYVNQYFARGEDDTARAFVYWGRRALINVSLLVGAVGLAVAIVLAAFRPIASLQPLIIAILGTGPLSLVFFHTSLLRAEKRILLSQLPLQLLRPLLGLGLGLLILSLGYKSGFGFGLAEIAGLALMVYPLSVLTRHLFPTHKPTITAEQAREWTTTTRGITTATVSQQLIGQADVLMVGMCFGMAEAGVYGLASRLGKLVVIGNRAANSIAGPLIAEAYHSDDKPLMQAVVSQACSLVIIGTLLMSAMLFLVPQSVFEWLGQGFEAARSVLLILLVGQVVNAGSGPVGTILLMTGNEQAQTLINLGFGLALAAGIFLLATFGGTVIGAAVLFSLATAGSNITKGFVVYRRTGVRSLPSLSAWRGGLRMRRRRK